MVKRLNRLLLRALIAVFQYALPTVLWWIYKGQRSWDIRMTPEAQAYSAGSKSYVACFWHSRILMMAPLYYDGFQINHKHALSMLVSPSRDGDIVERLAWRFRIKTIRGSGVEAPIAATRQMVRALRRGDAIGITPDGPRGPRYEFNSVGHKLAKDHQVPLFLCSFSCTKGFLVTRSWDHMLVPLPFGRGVLLIDGPFWLDDQNQEDMAERLNALTEEADRLCGRGPLVMPDAAERQAALRKIAKARDKHGKRRKALYEATRLNERNRQTQPGAQEAAAVEAQGAGQLAPPETQPETSLGDAQTATAIATADQNNDRAAPRAGEGKHLGG